MMIVLMKTNTAREYPQDPEVVCCFSTLEKGQRFCQTVAEKHGFLLDDDGLRFEDEWGYSVYQLMEIGKGLTMDPNPREFKPR